MRAASILFLLLASPVLAQTSPGAAAPAAAQESPTPRDKNNQRIERIRIEDQGSRVDELRVGGQTQKITVTPKVSQLPAYEVQPTDNANRRSSTGTTGPRVWNMLKF